MATLEQVLPTLEQEATNAFPNLDIQPATVEHDVFLKAPALLVDSENAFQQYATATATPSAFLALLSDTNFINNYLPKIFNVPTVAQAVLLLSSAVDVFAGNYGVVRNGGAASLGSVQLYFSSNLTVTVVAGTVFTTGGTLPQNFVSLQTFTGSPVSVGGQFVVTIPVQATAIGTDGNVPANTIISSQANIPGLISVTNTENTSGGTDEETDASVLERVIAKFQGTSIDTVQGVANVILNDGAFDCKVFRVGDPETQNRPGPDALAITEEADTVTDSFTLTATDLAGYIPEVQPLNPLYYGSMSIEGFPNAQFFVVPDTSPNGRSSRAQDRVVFFGQVPPVGTPINFTYIANKQVGTWQALFEPPNDQLFFDVLVKFAIRIDAAITMTVVLTTGVDSTAVVPQIKSTILGLVNALKMGQELDQAAVIAAVEAVPGVQNVVLPLGYFAVAGTSGVAVENSITAPSTSYIRLLSSNLIVNVV